MTSGKDLTLSGLLALFWFVLQLYPQYAAIAYPPLVGVLVIIYIFWKYDHGSPMPEPKTEGDRAGEIEKAYAKINDVAHNFGHRWLD